MSRPPLPPGRFVELPGRGVTFVRELVGPPGAPTVLLLHGWTVTADLNWQACYEPLSEQFRVLALDHRGHGRGLRVKGPFRLVDCADDVGALLEVLDIESVTLVGYSMGGPVALLTWQRHRARVASLVLCATAGSFETKGLEGALWRGALAGASAVTAALPRRARDAIIEQWVTTRTGDGDRAGWVAEELRRSDASTVLAAGAELGRFSALPWLSEVDVPTAVVITSQDSVVAPSRQKALATALRSAQVIEIAADHRAAASASDLFVPALVDGCARVTGTHH